MKNLTAKAIVASAGVVLFATVANAYNTNLVRRINLSSVTNAVGEAFAYAFSGGSFRDTKVEVDLSGLKVWNGGVFNHAFGPMVTKITLRDLETINAGGFVGVFEDGARQFSFDFPKLKTIRQGAFENSTHIDSISFDNIETISKDAFKGARINFTNSVCGAKWVDQNAFDCETNIGALEFPNITYCLGGSFGSISNVIFGESYDYVDYMFFTGENLKNVEFRNVQYIREGIELLECPADVKVFGNVEGDDFNLYFTKSVGGSMYVQCANIIDELRVLSDTNSSARLEITCNQINSGYIKGEGLTKFIAPNLSSFPTNFFRHTPYTKMTEIHLGISTNQVKSVDNYPFGMPSGSVIKCTDGEIVICR